MRSNLVLLLLLLPPLSPAQNHTRHERVMEILRMQDARVPFGAPMAGFLADADPAVRRRAALACGSLQDTAAIPPLESALGDSDASVAEAAAFAIGQSAARLSAAGRERFAEELIRRRIPRSRAAGRLTEETGKFAPAVSLPALVAARGTSDTVHTAMAIARSAVRGVTDSAATAYVLRLALGRAPVPWQVAYALQRIGDATEIRKNIAGLCALTGAQDPLVRMNLAVLLGKIHTGEACTAPLLSLASNDPDWRVHVSALRALSLCASPRRREVDGVFMAAFRERNVNVAVAALADFPPAGFRPADTSGVRAVALLTRISENSGGRYPWQVQSEAAGALARITHAVPLLAGTRGREIRPELRAALIRAAGSSLDSAAAGTIRACARSADPRIACAAIEALASLAHGPGAGPGAVDSAVAAARSALGTGDMAIVATAAGVLGDSLFRRDSSVPPLREALARLRRPEDVEAIQDVRDALRNITGRDYAPETPVPPRRTSPDTALRGWTGGKVRILVGTTRGKILVALDEDGAPFTVMSILRLVRAGFYDGLTFHRVVPNFVVQGGDPRGDGWGGPPWTLRSEFSTACFERGTVGIASAGKDTEGSQFFITHSPQPHLDGRYTVVGRVLRGMEAVDALRVGDRITGVRIVR